LSRRVIKTVDAKEEEWEEVEYPEEEEVDPTTLNVIEGLREWVHRVEESLTAFNRRISELELTLKPKRPKGPSPYEPRKLPSRRTAH
jgi:hypothetical protein